jgi:serine/threonine-protein kinase
MANLSGTELGRYQVLERLGRGGMAEVYKGYHQKLDRHVAIKILHGYLVEGEGFLTRFEREAQAVANLRHANIVQIHDFDVQDENFYMVMEFIDGGTLGDWAKSKIGNIDLESILKIMEQVASALDYAHNRGIVHRDIKPANILLDNERNVYLTDFGIARMISGTQTQFTATGALIGTPAYMSPEQCKGEDIDHISDIYSLGIILFELLTGLQPFEAETPLSILQKHITDPIPEIREHREDLPPIFDIIISKALAKDAGDRYQSAGALVDDLRKAVKQTLSDTQELTPEAPDETIKDTVVMEEQEIEDSTVKPTVVMEEVEPEAEEEIQEAEPEVETIAELETAQVEEAVPKARKPFPWKIAVPIALVVVAVGVVLGTGVLGGNGGNNNVSEAPNNGGDVVSEIPENEVDTSPETEEMPEEEPVEEPVEEEMGCVDPWSCREHAMEAWDAGDIAAAEEQYQRAIELIEGPIQEFAPIWCEFAELTWEINREDKFVHSALCFAAEHGLFGCESLEQCLELALGAHEAGRLPEAAEIYLWTSLHVPEDRFSEFAYIWCTRGEIMEQLGEPDLAEESFVTCEEWAQQ